MTDNPVRLKSFDLALQVISMAKQLTLCREYELSRQFIRAGTSVGANIEEAMYAQSRKDFLSKMTIALKEAVETQYWIRLMEESKILDSSKWRNIKALSKEVTSLLVAITKTTKERYQTKKQEKKLLIAPF